MNQWPVQVLVLTLLLVPIIAAVVLHIFDEREKHKVEIVSPIFFNTCPTVHA